MKAFAGRFMRSGNTHSERFPGKKSTANRHLEYLLESDDCINASTTILRSYFYLAPW
jgi:hypothetical protein